MTPNEDVVSDSRAAGMRAGANTTHMVNDAIGTHRCLPVNAQWSHMGNQQSRTNIGTWINVHMRYESE
jgi:hypothetical protein